jgi:Carboxypeptidase regulatory-like domain/Bacterial Ig-like domain (group 2)
VKAKPASSLFAASSRGHMARGTSAAIIAAMIACTAACDHNTTTVAPSTTTPGAASITSVIITTASTTNSSFHLSAAARMSDGTSRDVTSTATWESSNPSLAVVTGPGLVTVIGTGEIDVRATYQSVTGTLHMLVAKQPIVSVTITGSPSAPVAWVQLSAVARLSDGSTEDVTHSAVWSSSNPSIAAVSAGYVSAVASGDADITASYQGTSGSTHVSVAVARKFTVTGAVSEGAQGQRPVAGARVQIVGGSFTTTDDQGRFTLSGVPEGRELIEVSKQGYETFEQEIVVTGDMTYPVVLVPAAAP